MSYTPPQYVDTKAQAILALASVVADEDKTALGDGSVNKALDVLADAMAESDVQVPQTNAGAILALAQYIGGGGGGAQTVDINIWNLTEDESLMTVLPTEVRYITGFDKENNQILSDPLPFEHVTVEENGTTIHGVMVSGLPVGVCVKFTFSDAADSSFGLARNGAAADERLLVSTDSIVMAPVDGCIVVGQYYLAGNV